MTTRFITVRAATDPQWPHVIIVINSKNGLPIGLVAIDHPGVLDDIIAELQAARDMVWGQAGEVTIDTAKLIEAIKKDSYGRQV